MHSLQRTPDFPYLHKFPPSLNPLPTPSTCLKRRSSWPREFSAEPPTLPANTKIVHRMEFPRLSVRLQASCSCLIFPFQDLSSSFFPLVPASVWRSLEPGADFDFGNPI